MSIQAVSWAIEDAPDVPPHLVSVLIAIANHADRNGRGAYPSTKTVAYYARKSIRQAQRDIDDLESRGLIRRGDQRFVFHVRPDQRPTVWDLAIERRRARGDTHDTPSESSGVTPTTARGDTHVASGVTPTSPEPKEEPTTRTKEHPSATESAAPTLQLVLPGAPPAPVEAGSKRTSRKTKTEPQTRANEITDAWILAFRATGVEPTKRQIGAAARTAKELLQAGNEFERVLLAARSAGSRGYTTIDRELAHLATNGRRLTAVGSNSRSPYVDTRSNDDYSGELQ